MRNDNRCANFYRPEIPLREFLELAEDSVEIRKQKYQSKRFSPEIIIYLCN